MSNPIIDTNILVRLLTAEPPEQAEQVRRLFELVDRGKIEPQIPSLIVAEAVYVLQSFYKFTREDISKSMRAVLSSPGIVVENQALVLRAFEFYRNGEIAFADAYIAALSESSENEIISFDADYDKIKAVRRFKIPE